MNKKQHYLWIICIGRSGSEMLRRSLGEVGISGIGEHLKHWDPDIKDHFLPPTAKVFPQHINRDIDLYNRPKVLINKLLSLYPEMKFISLIRKDKIAQLTSDYIARTSFVWGLYDERSYYDKYYQLHMKNSLPTFIPKKENIGRGPERLYYNKIFMSIARSCGIPCLDITYEALSEGDEEWFRVFDFCGIDREDIRKTDKYRDKKYIIRDHRKEYYEQVYNKFKEIIEAG